MVRTADEGNSHSHLYNEENNDHEDKRTWRKKAADVISGDHSDHKKVSRRLEGSIPVGDPVVEA